MLEFLDFLPTWTNAWLVTSIYSKNDVITIEEPMKQKLKIKNITSIIVLNLIQMQNLDLSQYPLIDYQNSKDFHLFKLQYTKKSDINLLVFFFSLVRNRTIRQVFDLLTCSKNST